MASEGGTTAQTIDQAGKKERTGNATRMVGRVGANITVFREVLLIGLDGIPDGAINDGFAVIFDDEPGIFQDTNIDLVDEELMVAIDAVKEMSGIVDGREAGSAGADLESLAQPGDVIWIRKPAVRCSSLTVAMKSGDDLRAAHESLGRRTRDTAMDGHQITQTSGDILGEIVEGTSGEQNRRQPR